MLPNQAEEVIREVGGHTEVVEQSKRLYLHTAVLMDDRKQEANEKERGRHCE